MSDPATTHLTHARALDRVDWKKYEAWEKLLFFVTKYDEVYERSLSGTVMVYWGFFKKLLAEAKQINKKYGTKEFQIVTEHEGEGIVIQLDLFVPRGLASTIVSVGFQTGIPWDTLVVGYNHVVQCNDLHRGMVNGRTFIEEGCVEKTATGMPGTPLNPRKEQP